ncbi:transporter [Lactobacillus pasteurii DSM 23907 = CRBIP 24.76]|uniref:Transporter n=1 Tax=Lactobacillus pasteurii DSM 23907 = CRBIP 24.76 TaxID=1423790 RepID=I7KKB1_9LACO|nr:DUF554 domain-containing protein [Lactobacillus pasteurii]KRK07918.1 transporter [Lactobacillus pasteurii DSM 23907 = CRBIP 24.76]TDG77917.1 hypothetical protein C5L33_001722 [Lactobacillus pasteurii]CCI84314.1 Transporter [Lactobacillus pasteurii DSM 23907 = CRBIP 24.76]
MLGTIANTLALVVGTSIGALIKHGLKKEYENVLYQAMGLAALGIGLENVVNNLPKSQYHVLFIISLALGAIIGHKLDIDGHFNHLVAKMGKSELGKGLATEILLCCIGALSIVGPVMAAVKGDNTMLYTNATLDFVTSIVFGASFGWGMLVVPPVLFCWQGMIYLIAKYLSASFFTGAVIVEISIVGGFLITCTGLALLKIKDIKSLNFLPALAIPIIFFIFKTIFRLFL